MILSFHRNICFGRLRPKHFNTMYVFMCSLCVWMDVYIAITNYLANFDEIRQESRVPVSPDHFCIFPSFSFLEGFTLKRFFKSL